MSEIVFEKDNKKIRMVNTRNGGNGKYEKVQFAMEENEKLYMGADELPSITIADILDRKGFKKMSFLKDYDYTLTADDLKQIYENVKKALNEHKSYYETHDEMTVEEVLDEFFSAVEMKKEESVNLGKEEKEKFDIAFRIDEDFVMVNTQNIDALLEEIGAVGYTKTILCKKIRLLEQFSQKRILISNRSGGKGYTFNTTGNISFYKFRRKWRESNE